MNDEPIDDDIERLKQRWGIQDIPKAESSALAKAKAGPLPSKVLVERVREWGNEWGNVSDTGKSSAIYWRWFLYAVQPDGSRKQILNTTHEQTAEREVLRFQKLGVPIEVLKEHET